MRRRCTNCQHTFTRRDLAREQTRGMEADRKAAGLRGLLFHYYSCPECGQDDVFMEAAPLPGESPAAFCRRRNELEAVGRSARKDGIDVVVEKGSPGLSMSN